MTHPLLEVESLVKRFGGLTATDHASLSVMPGEVIAITGNTGRSTGPHMHLTCKFQNRYINPGILLQFVRETKEEAVVRLGIF